MAGCSSDSESDTSSADGNFSVERLLGQLPSSANEDATFTQIVFGDVDRATELSGTQRPSRGAVSDDGLIDWIGPLTGLQRGAETSAVYLPLPETVSPNQVLSASDFADELGWSIIDVRTYAELQNAPNNFAVLDQSQSADDITAAVGKPEGGIWRLGGDDFSVDAGGVTPARPLGESLRMATKNGLLAVARSTPPIEQWLSADGPTMADDTDLAAVAGGLDDAGVYSAMIVAGDFSISRALGLRATPEQVEAFLADADVIGPFDALGVGLTIADGDPVAMFVYHHASEADATANAILIEKAFADGTSFVDQRPFSEKFRVRDVKSVGDLVIATVGFADAPPQIVFQMIYGRDLLTTHS